MDTIALNPVGPAPVQRSGGGKTTLYIVVFFLCVISIVTGVFYYMLGQKDSDAANKLKELETKAAAEMAAAKSEAEKREIARKAEMDAEKAKMEAAFKMSESKFKAQEEMLKKAQARVDTELADAAKRVREAKELQRNAADVKAEAEARKLDAEAAMKEAEKTKDANAKKLADEKKRLADLADQKVVEANAKAARAVNDAKAEAKKAIDLQKRLDGAEAKLRGKRYEETVKLGAVPGYYTTGYVFAGDRLNVIDTQLCRNEARNNGWAAWGHRNSKHGDPKYRNSCFFYKTVPKYEGNPKDDIHMVGCAFGGNPRDGCRPGKYTFHRWGAVLGNRNAPGNDIWSKAAPTGGSPFTRAFKRARNRDESLAQCAADNRCMGLTCTTNGQVCWAKGKITSTTGDKYTTTWLAERHWR